MDKNGYMEIMEKWKNGKNGNINKNNIDSFNDLWSAIINKIEYLRGDDIIFDDNEVIIDA